MNELIEWYKQINSFERLKIKEAQELYKKAIDTPNETLKKSCMDKLILGTLYVVYEYIKRNGLELFTSSSYDMNDIISSFNEVWIKKIYNGELLNVDKYSLLFTQPFFNEVYNNLCGDEIIVNEQFDVPTVCLVDLLRLYVSFRNKPSTKSFEQIIKEKYYDTNKWAYNSYDKFVNIIPLLERIYNNLNFDKMDDLNITKTKIADYLRLIINIGLMEPISNEFPDQNDIEDEITTNITMRNFIDDVDKALTDNRSIQILHERFGLDGNAQSLESVSKKHEITTERVRQIEAKIFRKLRCNKSISKYKGEII